MSIQTSRIKRIKDMRVKDDMIVTVYRFPNEGFYPNMEGGFDMYIEMYTEVAFCEALQQLYVSIEGVKYLKSQYVSDILRVDSTEMLYKDYVQMYKDKLNAKFPDAPVLATIELDAMGRPKAAVPDHLKPVDNFAKLKSAGLNFSIQR